MLTIDGEMIEDGTCNATCNVPTVISMPDATTIGDDFCANGGCQQALAVMPYNYNITSIGDNFCRDGCYRMETFFSKRVV
jgi:hypothetical protein